LSPLNLRRVGGYQHRVTRTVWLAISSVAAFPAPLSSQGTPANDTVLARLTAEAIAANPSLERSRAMTRAATAGIRPAGALPDPMLSVGVMNLTLQSVTTTPERSMRNPLPRFRVDHGAEPPASIGWVSAPDSSPPRPTGVTYRRPPAPAPLLGGVLLLHGAVSFPLRAQGPWVIASPGHRLSSLTPPIETTSGGCQDAGSSDEGCARYSSVC
jgi:hypothetical protein